MINYAKIKGVLSAMNCDLRNDQNRVFDEARTHKFNISFNRIDIEHRDIIVKDVNLVSFYLSQY